MSFKPVYIPFAQNQIDIIKSSTITRSLPKISLTKQQLLAMSDLAGLNLVYLPLTSLQLEICKQAQQTKNDVLIELNPHQLQDMLAKNWNLEIDIADIVLRNQKNKRVFKK